MAIVMNMSSYEVEETSSAGCVDEIRHTGWNPQLELATRQHLTEIVGTHGALPVSLLTADAEMFLQSMYAYKC